MTPFTLYYSLVSPFLSLIFPPSPPAKPSEKMMYPLLATIDSPWLLRWGLWLSSIHDREIGGPCLVWESIAVCIYGYNGEDF